MRWSDKRKLLPSPLDFRHRVELQLRFSDMDRLGHVNNGVYMQYYDLGRMGYFESLPHLEIDWNAAIVVLAHYEVDFYAPLCLGKRAGVATRVVEIYERRLVMEQQLYDEDTLEAYGASRSLMIGFNASTGTSCPLLPAWISSICEAEGLALLEG